MTSRPRSRIIQELPAPYGDPGALDAAAGTAAPILAGFAVVLVGLILEGRFQLWHKDLALLLLVTAVLLLIAAVEFAFTARRYYVGLDDFLALVQLATEATATQVEAAGADQAGTRTSESQPTPEGVIASYLIMLPRHKTMARYGRYAYNAGVVCFLVGVGLALVPPGGPQSPLRIAATAAVGLAAVAELLWDLTPDRVRWRPAPFVNGEPHVQRRSAMQVVLVSLATGLLYGFIWRIKVSREMRWGVGPNVLTRQWTIVAVLWDIAAAALLTLFYYVCAVGAVMWIIGEWHPQIWWAAAAVGFLFCPGVVKRLRAAEKQLHMRSGRISSMITLLSFVLPPVWYGDVQVRLNGIWSEIDTQNKWSASGLFGRELSVTKRLVGWL